MNIKKYFKVVAPLLLVLTIWNIQPTFAYLAENIPEVLNGFRPTNVKGEIEEDIEGEVKKSVLVEYKGNTAGYVRVKLVPEYRDDEGNLTVEPISIKDFTYDNEIGTSDWFEKDGCYYYRLLVQPAKGDESNPKLQFPFKNITAPVSKEGNTAVLNVLVQTVDELHVEEAWKVIVTDGVIK